MLPAREPCQTLAASLFLGSMNPNLYRQIGAPYQDLSGIALVNRPAVFKGNSLNNVVKQYKPNLLHQHLQTGFIF